MGKRYRTELSPEVAEAIARSGVNLDETLRKIFNIKSKTLTTPEGIEIPDGTDFMVWYAGRNGEGRPYWAKLRDGRIEMRGAKYESVSAAAAAVTGRATTNGWTFWQIKMPGQNKFIPLDELRQPGAETAIRVMSEDTATAS